LVLLILLTKEFFDERSALNASYFGSFLSGITSLIAIFLLYKTYQSQKNELELTRKIAAEQANTLHEQKIENAIFTMLSALRETISLMDGEINYPPLLTGSDHFVNFKGRQLLRNLSKELSEALKESRTLNFNPTKNCLIESIIAPIGWETGDDETYYPAVKVINEIEHNFKEEKDKVVKKYEAFYANHAVSLGHYFRYLYNIIKFILESKLEKKNEMRYLNLLQAELSNDEMQLIFYNAVSRHGKKKDGSFGFHKWLDEYSILENIDQSNVISRWHHWFYPKTIFKFLNDQEREEKLAVK
jgi:hypothetical protein